MSRALVVPTTSESLLAERQQHCCVVKAGAQDEDGKLYLLCALLYMYSKCGRVDGLGGCLRTLLEEEAHATVSGREHEKRATDDGDRSGNGKRRRRHGRNADDRVQRAWLHHASHAMLQLYCAASASFPPPCALGATVRARRRPAGGLARSNV
ncbi:hypothetical protein U9M48_026820 [Paspalum notatum var. saurae]|uniref:Uncharacterized protein n=1 Tax=Paspalum notatum var. saurae TaxID=547442 RepID=A0AAQ3TRP4_PASNO